MHFKNLREEGDCISNAIDGHVNSPMLELLFLRRGAVLKQREKALFVYLGVLKYTSKVCVLTFATGTNTCVLDTLWLCDNTGEAVGGWGFAKSP